MTFSELKKNLKKDNSQLKKVKLAVLADSATQLFVQALKGYAYEVGLNFEIFEADYNQIELQVYDSGSELYKSDAESVIIFHSVQKLLKKFYSSPSEQRINFADNYINELNKLVSTINANQKVKIIYLTFPELDDAVFGNYGNKLNSSWIFQLRKVNYELMILAQNEKSIFLADVTSLQNHLGSNFLFDPKMYINADMVFSIDFLPSIAKCITDIILAVSGRVKKCLILDLDNTMWGGIIGDDGIENIQIGDLGIGKAFSLLQLWIKELKERGIILAICSKNTEEIAKEPFEKHPEMILKLNDIALFVANWDSKVDNIKYIQSVLNIGFDSMVFIDDNPFERGVVRTHLPEVTVPELPEDPAEYLTYLRSLNLFETASFSQEDKMRTQQYQEESGRTKLQRSFTSEEDFLKSLNMVAVVKPFDKYTAPRVAQLSQRSNQFNLRTVRYTEDDILKLISSPDHYTLTFSLNDKFGDYGLISIIILKKRDKNLFIDTWIMSCRVLKRGMENFVLNQIATIALDNKFNNLMGEYIPTPKNGIVKDHYSKLGFTKNSDFWELDVKKYSQSSTHISTEK